MSDLSVFSDEDNNPATPDTNLTTTNNLLDITINATQALTVDGEIVFESVVGDDVYTLGDNDAATATLTVNGDSAVNLGVLNTTDDDVDALDVINNGTGTLTLTVDASQAGFDAADALSFTGTGAVVLNTVGTLDLSDDTLDAVTTINVSQGSSVTVSFAQLAAIGAANINAAGNTGAYIDCK